MGPVVDKNRQEFGEVNTLHKELVLDQQVFEEHFKVDKKEFETL